MLHGFKQFVLRGNVVDLAIGVVIGAAFGNVVTALVKDLLTPLLGAIAHVPDFSGLKYTLRGSDFMYGDFINALISFILVALAVYFFVVLPMNTLLIKMKRKDAPLPPTSKKCTECLSEIPLEARRCSHCIQPVQ